MLDQSLETCLSRIREREAELECWVEVSPLAPLGEGSLSGLCFGVKDIFAVEGLRFECGSPVFAGRRATQDCSLVRRLRKLGGTVVGKTHTTSFAYFDPAPTRNPHRAGHTPGGSSSGAAAAVAAGMVPMAIGSQTQGSVLRPASFCGVAGFKPTHGLIDMTGVMPFAPMLDTAGFFTATAADMAELWRRMHYGAASSTAAPRLAAFTVPDDVEQPMREAVLAAAAKLGAPVIAPPVSFPTLWQAVRLIQEFEGARTHEDSYLRHRDQIGKQLSILIANGLATSEADYRAAIDQLMRARHDMAALFAQYDVILSPSALGPAPATLATSTGHPKMNAPWTGLGSPAISIPLPVAKGALPLGLQLAAAPGRDTDLLAYAAALDAIVRG
ncbi:MAG: amidase [Acidobacteria bacterium]|nr:amidase [Acidobacteriota bacterium]